MGVEAYNSEQRQKLEILKFLLEHYNDGRRKSFFCLSVNLLDLEDLKTVVEHLVEENQLESLTLKEKSAGNVTDEAVQKYIKEQAEESRKEDSRGTAL